MIELLVVISIIGVLVALLLPLRQLVGVALEQLPEVETPQRQAQVLVRTATLPLPRRQPMRVPVQSLQVQHRLRHPLVVRLLLPQHPVEAFHHAARAHRTGAGREDGHVGHRRRPGRDA